MTGKKFSLQDWVTRRAANQSGNAAGGVTSRVSSVDAIEPLSIKKAVNGDSHLSSVDANDRSGEVSQSSDSGKVSAMEGKLDNKSLPNDVLSKVSERGNPVQQLQIVRLLSDLGERLRQSEKEREILWKEIETCRQQISDIHSKNEQSEKTVHVLEGQVGQKEDFIKGLLDKQAEMEELLKNQTTLLETDKSDRVKFEEKFQEKISGIETTTGSAIVRIEDALVENNKLSKRIEQLSQDKTRLSRKLEVMEEALTQTQETLKAKALVLLTDQALATKTSLPQTSAWTGDDTLRVSTPRESSSSDAQGRGPVADIAASIQRSKKGKSSDMSNTAFLAALIVLGIAGGVLLGQFNYQSFTWPSVSVEKVIPQENVIPSPSVLDDVVQPSVDGAGAEKNQDEIMADIADLANKIEPAIAETTVDTVVATDFDKAIDAEDRALEKFRSESLTGAVSSRIKADKNLPAAVKDIEKRAFTGDAIAQHDLAAVYTAGHAGVKVSYDRAVKWFTEAAHQNVANAQYNLAVLYHQGLGVEKNVGKAIDMYRVAAANGHPEAQYNLAIAYIEGVGAEYNPQIAAVYFQKAAAGGIVEAAYNLGLLHENGLLGESQPDEAVFWYTLAADKGNALAVTSLKQIKDQLSMSNEDAARIVARIAESKPGFLNEEGKAVMPDPVPVTHSDKETVSFDSDKAASALLSSVADVDHVVVSQIQEQLSRTGLYSGALDGVMSSSIEAAIKSYQKKFGLKQDGQPSETLLVHILANQTDPSSGL